MSDETTATPDETVPPSDSPEETGESTPEGEESEATEGEPAQAEEDEEDAGTKAPPGRSEAFDKLLAKYGGDYDKLAESVFEQYNSTARTHEELVELRAILEEMRSSKATAEQVEKVVAEDPNVQKVSADLASISAKATAVTEEMKVMVTEYQKRVTAVAKLEGALSKADDNERFEISQDLRDARRDLRDIEQNYQIKSERYQALKDKWDDAQARLQDAQNQARTRVDRDRQDASRLQQEAAFTKREYQESLKEEARRYGIDPTSKQYDFIDKSFKAQLANYMRALQAQGQTEGIDVPQAVGYLMKEYAEGAGLTKKFSKTSAEKDKVATPQRKATPAGPPGTKKEGEMSAAEWKARARQMMP